MAQEHFQITYNYTDSNDFTYPTTLIIANKEAVFFADDPNKKPEPAKDKSPYDMAELFYSTESNYYHKFLAFKDNTQIFYTDNPKKIKWNINEDRTKKIGKYNCKEAKTFLMAARIPRGLLMKSRLCLAQ